MGRGQARFRLPGHLLHSLGHATGKTPYFKVLGRNNGKSRENVILRHSLLWIASFRTHRKVDRKVCFILLDTDEGESVGLRHNRLWISVLDKRRKVRVQVRFQFVETKEGKRPVSQLRT
jgi:hypothetical protein